MINTILESDNVKSPLHNFLTTLITTKHQHDTTIISSSQQLKYATRNATRYNAHAYGTNRAKPST